MPLTSLLISGICAIRLLQIKGSPDSILYLFILSNIFIFAFGVWAFTHEEEEPSYIALIANMLAISAVWYLGKVQVKSSIIKD